jgi:hypothetical protein
MSPKVFRFALLGQLALFVFRLFCFLLIPHFLLQPDEGGVSNYGLYEKTVVPYSLAFGLVSICTTISALNLPKEQRSLRTSLFYLSGLYLLVLLTTYPYKLNDTLNSIHSDSGALLFISMSVLGIWLATVVARHLVTTVLCIFELMAFGLAVLNYYGYLHVLFIAEGLTGSLFGLLLIQCLSILSARFPPLKEPPKVVDRCAVDYTHIYGNERE